MKRVDTHVEAVLTRRVGVWSLVLTLAAGVTRTCRAACEKEERSC